MKRLLTFILFPALMCCSKVDSFMETPTQNNPRRDLSVKDIYTTGYPNYMFFRAERDSYYQGSESAWCNTVNNCLGISQKFLNEEQEVDHQERRAMANAYAKANPTKLVLLHYNGRARSIYENNLDVIERFYPGHWAYSVGSMITEDVDPTQTTISVDNGSRFTCRYRINGGEWMPRYVTIVPYVDGSYKWEDSEYCAVTSDRDANSVSLERGVCRSTPKSYVAGQAMVLPIVAVSAGMEGLWMLNMSYCCPLDSDGKRAGDISAEVIAENFAVGGALEEFDGITFDVTFWEPNGGENFSEGFDTNLDGVVDNGYIQGVNKWREGSYLYFKKLRQLLGDDFLMTTDATRDDHPTCLGLLNGIESEGFVHHDDKWRGFSRPVNIHSYWFENNPVKYKYQYIVGNTNNKDIEHNRFVMASACALGSYPTGFVMDYFSMPHQFNKPGSLGKIVGPLIQFAKSDESKVSIIEGEELYKRIASLGGCNIQTELTNDGVVVRSSGIGAGETNMKFSIEDIAMPTQDVTFFVRARSLDVLDGVQGDENVYRIFKGKLREYRFFDNDRVTAEYANSLFGYVGMNQTTDVSFYYRRPSYTEESTNAMDFDIQGVGRLLIKQLIICNAPQVIAREFERGYIVVNPSLDRLELDLKDIFPTSVQSSRMVAIEPTDAIIVGK